MKNDLTCEVVQDLLPCYIDHLTCDITNTAIEQHLAGCTECNQMYSDMSQPPVSNETEDEVTIDYLKKSHTRNRNHVAIGMIIIAVLSVTVYFICSYMISKTVTDTDLIDYNISFTESGDTMILMGSFTDHSIGCSGVSYTENGDSLTIQLKSTLVSPFHANNFCYRYQFPDSIRRIYLNNRIIWEDGANILPQTAEIYDAIHPYVGSMSDNGKTLTALNIHKVLPITTSELQTSQEPFGWTLTLEGSFSKDKKQMLESKLKSYAVAILVSTENLGSVSFDYHLDAEATQYTYTKKEAENEFGHELSYYRESSAKLQSLLTEIGIVNGPVSSDS